MFPTILVCQVLLAAKVVAADSGLVTRIEPGKGRVILVLSPHADDATLFIGALEDTRMGDLSQLVENFIGEPARTKGTHYGVGAAEEFRVVRLDLPDTLKTHGEPVQTRQIFTTRRRAGLYIGLALSRAVRRSSAPLSLACLAGVSGYDQMSFSARP